MTDGRHVGAVIHHLPGRARLRFPALRGDEDELHSVAARLVAVAGMTAVRPNATTGTILFHYEGAWSDICSLLSETASIDLDQGAVNAEPHILTDSRMGARTLTGLALGALAAVQVVRERTLPPAVTLLWYAANLLTARTSSNK